MGALHTAGRGLCRGEGAAPCGEGAAWRTFTAVLPHPEVHSGHVITAAIPVGELGHSEHVALHTCDVVCVVAQDPGQGRLLDLRQLRGGKHPRILIPQPATPRKRTRSDRPGTLRP